MKLKKLTALALAAAVAVSLAACGEKAAPTTESTTEARRHRMPS